MFRDYFPPPVQVEEPSPPLAKRIAVFYARQAGFIKRMKRFIWVSGLLFLLVIFAGIIFFVSNPELTSRWMAKFSAEFIRGHPRRANPWGQFLQILMNNLGVSFRICLAGLVPFFLPSAVGLIANAGALSLILASLWIRHEPVVFLFSTLILPHGIIELPTFIFVAGFSLYLSSQMTKRIFRKKPALKTETVSLFGFMLQDDLPDRLDAIGDILEVLVGVILPLLLIAALLETFVTPFIYRLLA
jgi:stage II sporulation protein M